MALLLARQRFDVVDISLRDKSVALLALSPKGTVPVLHLPDGQVIDESWLIMAWAFAAGPQRSLWQAAQSPVNLELVQRNDGVFKQQLDRYKYPERYAAEGKRKEQSRDLAVTTLLGPLQDQLHTQAFLGGTTACATDLAIFPYVRQFAAVDPAWFAQLPMPALQAWLSHWLDSELFAMCMRRTAAPVGSADAASTDANRSASVCRELQR